MKRNVNIILIMILGAAILSACATGNPAVVTEAGIQRNISVSGLGSVKIVPDIAYINIGVRNQSIDVQQAIEANNIQAQTVKDALVANDIEEDDIQTSSFNVFPQNEYDFNGQVIATYYIVENNVYITVRDLSNVGDLLSVVTQSGANSIYGISFDVSDKTDALSQARELAIEDARNQAEEIAELTGVKLGEVLSVNLYSSSAPFIADAYFGMGGGGYAVPEIASKVPVSAGNLVITTSVSVSYEIK